MDIAIIGAGNIGRALAASSVCAATGWTWQDGWKLTGPTALSALSTSAASTPPTAVCQTPSSCSSGVRKRGVPAWMTVSEHRRQAIVGSYVVLSRPVPGPGRLSLRGLDPAASYRVSLWPAADDGLARANEGLRGGDEFMSAGLRLVSGGGLAGLGDFRARLFALEVE